MPRKGTCNFDRLQAEQAKGIAGLSIDVSLKPKDYGAVSVYREGKLVLSLDGMTSQCVCDILR